MGTQDTKVAVFFLEARCNMVCEYCVTQPNLVRASLQNAHDFLDYLKSRNIMNIILGGGEPFCWPHGLLALTERAKEMGFYVQIGTNGILLPKGFETTPSIDRFVMPLDSHLENVHNSLRRFDAKSHYKIIIDRISNIKRVNKSLTLSTVVTKLNIASVLDLAKFLKEFTQGTDFLHAWHLYQFMPTGRGGYVNADKLAISSDDYLDICSQVKDMNLDFTTFKRKNMYRPKTVEFFWYEKDSLISGIDTEGHIDPVEFDYKPTEQLTCF